MRKPTFFIESMISSQEHSEKISSFIDSLTITRNHQIQFSKNFDLVKKKHSRLITTSLAMEELKKSQSILKESKPQTFCKKTNEKEEKIQLERAKNAKIYIFLALIAVFELSIQKYHQYFV